MFINIHFKMENTFLKCFVFIIVFLGQFNMTNGDNCSAYFDSSQLQWNDARSKCRLVGNDSDVPLEDIKVKLQNSVNTFGWIDALGTYQPWMEYIGCFVISTSDIQRAVTVRSGNQLLDCIIQCTGYLYIGLQNSKCVCVSNVSDASNTTCTAHFCNGDENSFCSSDSDTINQYALYRRGTISVNENIGECLAITITNSGLSSSYDPAPCGSSLYPLCFNNGRRGRDRVIVGFTTNHAPMQSVPIITNIGTLFRLYSRTTWNGAVMACSEYSAVLASPQHMTSPGVTLSGFSYWLAQVRPVQINLTEYITPGEETYCVAARVMSNGYLQTFLSSCSVYLSGLCYNNCNTSVVTVCPHPSPRIISKELLSLIIVLPGTIIVCALAIVVCLMWRCCAIQHMRRSNKSDTVDLTINEARNNSPNGDCGATADQYDDISQDCQQKEGPHYYSIEQPVSSISTDADCSTFGKTNASVECGSPVEEEDTYNHVTHLRCNDTIATGYDVIRYNDSKLVINGYDDVKGSSFTKTTYDYDTMASIRQNQNLDLCIGTENETVDKIETCDTDEVGPEDDDD